MSKFGIDINFNYDSVKLDKLFDDANKSGKANLTSNQNNVGTNYNATSATSYNQTSNSQVETLDLSAEVKGTNQQNINNASSQEMSNKVSSNANISQSTNTNVTTPTNTTTSQSTSFTQSQTTNNTVNNVGLSNNTTSQNNISNISGNTNNSTSNTPTPNNSSNDFNLNTNNLSNNSNSSKTSIDIKTDTNDNFSKAGTNSNNQNTASNNNNSMNISTNNNTSNSDSKMDIDFSDGFATENETDSSSKIVVRNGKVFATSLNVAGETVEVEIERDEYIANLKSYGINNEDINRIISGEISPENLLEEIQSDNDSTRRDAIMTASYLQSFGLPYTTLQELEDAIASGGSETEKNQYIHDYITRKITYNKENIDKYVYNEDFNANTEYKRKDEDVVSKLVDRYKGYTSSQNDGEEKDGLAGWFNRQIERQVMYETNNNEYTEYITEKEDVVDLIANMLNGSSVDGNILKSGGNLVHLKTNDTVLNHYFEWQSIMSDTEVDIFNYIYNTKGYEDAYEYLNGLSDELDERWLAKKTQEDQEFAEQHPVIASVASIVVTPIEGMSAVCYSLNSFLTGEKIRRTDVYSSGDVWRGQVGQSIAEDYGENWAFIYNAAMSMADTATLVALSYATGGMANVVLSATLMGSRAYVSTLNDALDRGISDGAAIALAFSSAAVETAMESWSVGHLLNLESALGKTTSSLVTKVANSISNPALASVATKSTYVIASALSQGLCEGEEEFATEIVNYVVDELISGDLSNHTLAINNYMAQGYSEEESWLLACKDFAGQLKQAFLGGFVSGICFGSFSGVNTTHQVSKNIAANITADFEGTKAQAFAKIIEANTLQQQVNEEQVQEKPVQEIAEEIKITDNLQEQVQSSVQSSNEDVQKIFDTIPEFSTEDITALMANATVSNFQDKLDFKKLYSVFHSTYDSTFGSEYVDKTLSEFKIIKQENWNEVCAAHGLSGQEILGFVDKYSNLYLPENANMHTGVHEGMHKFSEHMKKIITLKDGTTRKVTGIREFFDDGTDSGFANEALTDYLASKIYDGVIYESAYSSTNVRLWERIDNLLTVKYGENQNILLEAYNANNANAIRAIFDGLCGHGTYNTFVKTMSLWYAKGVQLNSIVEQLEKAVKPKSIFSRIKDIFKSTNKPTNQIKIDNSINLENTSTNILSDVTAVQGDFDNSLFITKILKPMSNSKSNSAQSVEKTVHDIEFAIRAYQAKYRKSRQEVLSIIETISKNGEFNLMTSSENARNILQQHSLEELQQALHYMSQNNMGNNIEYNQSINQPRPNVQQNISERIGRAVYDIEFAIQGYQGKYNASRKDVLGIIKTISKTGDFSIMTSSGNARSLLQQYDLSELEQALDYMNQNDQANQPTTLEQAIIDVKYALLAYEKKGYSKEDAIINIKRLAKTWNFDVIVDNKIRNLLKQYDIPQIQMALEDIEQGVSQPQSSVNNTSYSQQNASNVQTNISERIGSAVYDIEFAIQAYIEKYGKSRQDVIREIQTLINTRDFTRMTRYNNARARLVQYDISELQQALDYMEQNSSSPINSNPNIVKPKFAKLVNMEQHYYSMEQVLSTVKNPIRDYTVLNKLYKTGGDYGNLVRAINDGYVREMPTVDRIKKHKERFFDSLDDFQKRQRLQGNAFLHYWSSGFGRTGAVTDRLYINMDNNDTLDFVQLFADQCEARNIPYYFKTAPFITTNKKEINEGAFTRDESIVIYAESKYLVDYINICNYIMNNYNLTAFQPPILTGVINGYLGYGAEPNNESERYSYNSLRAELIANACIQMGHTDKDGFDLNDFFQKICRLCQEYGIDSNTFFLNNKK